MIHYSKLKALIVEDFTEFARAVSTMLRDMGLNHTDTVTSAEAAIQACREHKYDLILSDYNLGPQKDGQQLLEELIEFKLIKPKTIFVMVTAEKNAAMVMAAIEFLPDAYVTKPFNRHLLKTKLDKAIEKKQTLEPIKIAMRKLKWLKAIELCASISEQSPKYKNTCNQLKIECLIKCERLEDADRFIQQLLKKRTAPWVLRSKGIILYKQNEHNQAVECFNQLIHDYPMYLEGYDWLAKIQHQLNRPIEAQKTLQKAVTRSPKLIKRQKFLGHLAENNNDIHSMTEAYRQAVKYGEHSIFRSAEEYVKLTKSIGLQLKGDVGRQRKKLINEANTIFNSIEQVFKDNPNTQFRGAVAHADFSAVIKDRQSTEKYIEKSYLLFNQVEEHLQAYESLEIAESLKSLGLNQLAESVLEEAIEQYFDDPVFIKQAARLTNNKHLIKNASKANQLNNLAVAAFKAKELEKAIDNFNKAAKIAPNNVNICLNLSQVLLKHYQSSDKNSAHLYRSEEILAEITRLSITDPRYTRYSELTRLNQLMIQKLH